VDKIVPKTFEDLKLIELHCSVPTLPMPGLQNASRKRPAVSQGGPKLKKQHSENPSSTKFEEGKVQKRSRPVTQPIPANGLSDEDEDEDEDEDNFEEEEAEDQEIVSDEMIVDDAISKDPNGMLTITQTESKRFITF
jgi:hypothetical protein